jgi:hypothetical protein
LILKADRIMRIVAVVLVAFIVAFLAINVISSAGNSYKTSTAMITTVADTIDADMFIIRDEIVVEGSESGVVVPLAVNGERVGKGSEIAAVFSNETAAENYSSSITLSKKLETYKKIDSQVRLANLDLEKLSTEVYTDFYAMLDSVYSNDFSNITEDELSFSENLSRKNISLGYDVDCTSQIESLEAEIASLSVSEPTSVISAESSGYFVSRPDGYENILTTADVDSLTEEKLVNALKAEKSEISDTAMGKIITGYEWYIATIVSSADMADVEAGKTMSLMLGDGENETVKAKLYSKNIIDDNRVILIFKTSYMNEELATLRKVNGKILVRNYKGIKIRKDAVRFINDEDGNQVEGVYIVEGNVIKFNRIEEIYSNDSVVVASTDKSGTAGWLSQYDEIVISGKELSNGKVIA